MCRVRLPLYLVLWIKISANTNVKANVLWGLYYCKTEWLWVLVHDCAELLQHSFSEAHTRAHLLNLTFKRKISLSGWGFICHEPMELSGVLFNLRAICVPLEKKVYDNLVEVCIYSSVTIYLWQLWVWQNFTLVIMIIVSCGQDTL